MKSSFIRQKLEPASRCFGGTGIQSRKPLIFAVTLFLLSSGLLVAQDREEKEPFLPSPVRSVSTVPANGDVNPYGVAFVPRHFPSGGTVNTGDILVSNFNNSNNLQGTGTTIVRVPANGSPTVFFQGQAPLGLSTALTILRKGFVLVGNFRLPMARAEPLKGFDPDHQQEWPTSGQHRRSSICEWPLGFGAFRRGKFR